MDNPLITLTLNGTGRLPMVFFQNMHVYKTFKAVHCVHNLDAQVFNILLFKKVLVLNEEILSSIYKKWLFEPNDAFLTISQ